MRLMYVAAALALAATLLAPPTRAEDRVPWAESHLARYFALRLRPGQDLLAEIQRFAREHELRGAFVASCSGSARRTSVRFANQLGAAVREGHFEIVSLSGTLAGDGAHVHVAFADSTGAAFGGHLMTGTLVYTTAEIVLGELDDVAYAREADSTYGYRELVPRRR
jgi:hypothetical protein